ncbi:AbiV family abortive infection protein [Streptomyces sp. NPDC006539]|uniref:AbiV family abortive infection protein n=1 Tax=Streptomyces sp. NPDC006539 TaxID=3155352 RepID=UPI0033BBA6D4
MAKLPTDPHEMERIVVGPAAAAFKNARDMLTSAQAVLDAQIWPTAFSMAALALEEVGKAALCMTMLGKSPETNTRQRLGEAQRMQWLGEVAGLQESLRHIAAKKQQVTPASPSRKRRDWEKCAGVTASADSRRC